MLQSACKVDCTAGLFKRLNFFHGMLLAEQDFRDEQEYFREKLKMHNRLLHGYGIVIGLGLKKKDPESAEETTCQVYIEPGVALDCDGNEIIVCNEHVLNLTAKLEELKKKKEYSVADQCSPPGPLWKIYVGIRYCECKSDPEPQYTSSCSDDQLHPEFSRTREGFKSKLFTEIELPSCPEFHVSRKDSECHKTEEICEGAFRCTADPHYVILGRIEIYDENICTCKNIDIIESEKKFYHIWSQMHSNEVYFNWETAKFAMIAAASRALGWKDISIVIGRNVANATNLLQSFGMTVSGCKAVTDCNIEDLIKKIKCVVPFAKKESTIELICDKSGKCVLFPLIKT
jgi:hypothetical protein